MAAPRRVLVFLLGYVAAAASAAIALVLYLSIYFDITQNGPPLLRAQTIADFVPTGGKIVALLLLFCLPVGWIPLAVGLVLWRRVVGRFWLLGCILVGTITGVASLVWFVAVLGGDVAHAIDKGTVARFPYAASAGAFGGLVFWAIALRRDQVLKGTAEAPVPDREG